MYKACKIKSRYVVKDPIGPELLLTHKLKYHVQEPITLGSRMCTINQTRNDILVGRDWNQTQFNNNRTQNCHGE